jgi:hypothetical protein
MGREVENEECGGRLIYMAKYGKKVRSPSGAAMLCRANLWHHSSFVNFVLFSLLQIGGILSLNSYIDCFFLRERQVVVKTNLSGDGLVI